MDKIYIIPVVILFVFYGCAGSKGAQKLDGPEDYYETESSLPETTAKTADDTSVKTENKAEPEKIKKIQTINNPAPSKQATQKSTVPNNTTDNQVSPSEIKAPTKTEENTIPPELQEELGDDSWGKDENKVKLKKKDRDRIKNSPPDDDKWGKD